MTLDDIEAALWRRFPRARVADVDALRAMILDYVIETGAALAAQEVPARRRAEIVSANGLTVRHGGKDRAGVLLRAHTEAARLRANQCDIPGWLADLDREYERNKKRDQRRRRALATQAPELDAEAGEAAA